MIRALVVDDDFRVARVHAEVAAKVPGFTVVAQVHTGSAALQAIERHAPDLVLLDLYLPDINGLDVLERTRGLAQPPDVIVLSAANDMESVRTAMRRGALHYLTKPFYPDALHTHLIRYAELHTRRAGEGPLTQEEIDALFGVMRHEGAPRDAPRLPKGQWNPTAQMVLDELAVADEPLSAVELAQRLGISRATAYRYLSLLLDAGAVNLGLRYGGAGRPEHRYELVAAGPQEP